MAWGYNWLHWLHTVCCVINYLLHYSVVHIAYFSNLASTLTKCCLTFSFLWSWRVRSGLPIISTETSADCSLGCLHSSLKNSLKVQDGLTNHEFTDVNGGLKGQGMTIGDEYLSVEATALTHLRVWVVWGWRRARKAGWCSRAEWSWWGRAGTTTWRSAWQSGAARGWSRRQNCRRWYLQRIRSRCERRASIRAAMRDRRPPPAIDTWYPLTTLSAN